MNTSRLVAHIQRAGVARLAVDGPHARKMLQQLAKAVEVPRSRSRRAGRPSQALEHAVNAERETLFESLAPLFVVIQVELN